MISEIELLAIEARAAETTGVSWESGLDADGMAIVRVSFRDGHEEVMRITRDTLPADRGDVEFIAHARRDLGSLISAVRGNYMLRGQDLDGIESRLTHASPGPWRAFLEEDGGLGGCDVISVSDDDEQPDLYIWLAEKLASSADFRFVAAARQDIATLIATVSRSDQ